MHRARCESLAALQFKIGSDIQYHPKVLQAKLKRRCRGDASIEFGQKRKKTTYKHSAKNIVSKFKNFVVNSHGAKTQGSLAITLLEKIVMDMLYLEVRYQPILPKNKRAANIYVLI